MSSDDDLRDIDEAIPELGHSIGSAKRRKVLRACDVCRRKKIRCDAHDNPDTRCTHCITYKLDCTFIESAKKRGPPKGYIDDLEKRCKDLELLIARVAPQVNIEDEVGPSFTKDTWAAIKGYGYSRSSRSSGPRSSSGHTQGPPRHNDSPTLPESPSLKGCFPLRHAGLPIDTSSIEPMTLDISAALDSSDERNYPGKGTLTKHIESQMEEMKINNGFEKRFHGKSSGVTLIQVAMNLKDEVVGDGKYSGEKAFPLREKYWRPNPWEWVTSSHPPLDALHFPPDDLAETLIELCFSSAMIIFPVIHRQTFTKLYKAGMHKKDVKFARLYLLVCAVGCRYTDDQRTCLLGPSGEIEWNSAGWMYFAQVMAMKRPLLAPVGLSDLQCTALMCLYLQGTSAPHAAWLLAGIGLRFAQDIGAHREKVYGSDHPFENQMWKRAFWSLVALDRMASAGLGRPIAVFDEDIDADLPVEVDDEYYDEVAKEWKQPEGKPARISAFIHYVKLQGILAYAIRTVYSINKSKVHLGFVGPEWESHTVAELDSALNSWLDNIPDFLRWDPAMKDPIHYQQAAALRLTYHYVQITIHRPFIPVLNAKSSALAFPSLAICSNAARSTSHIIENFVTAGYESTPLMHVIAFTAGTVLLISIWGVKKNKLNVDLTSQVADVQRCIKVLHKAEKKWHTAGRLCDILTELASVNDVPLPQNTPTPPDTTRKREREADDEDDIDADVASPITRYPDSTYTLSPLASALSSTFSNPSPLFRSSAGLPGQQALAVNVPFNPQERFSLPTTLNGMGGQPSMDAAFNAPGAGAPLAMPWGVPTIGQSDPWDTYHIGGVDVPGMNMNISRDPNAALPGTSFEDSMSPYTLFQGLLNAFNNPASPDQQQQSVWGMQGEAEYGWLNEIGMYSLTPGAAPPAPSAT